MLIPSTPGLWIWFWGQPRGDKADGEGGGDRRAVLFQHQQDREQCCSDWMRLVPWDTLQTSSVPSAPGIGSPRDSPSPGTEPWTPHCPLPQGSVPSEQPAGSLPHPDPALVPPSQPRLGSTAPLIQLHVRNGLELQVTKGKVIELLSLVRFILIH